MDLSMGSTEGIVLALLDFLVDPLLPSSSSYSKQIVSPSQEELVAKQVHAVVLLYNYYHRIQHPNLPFLEFQPFCKMAATLKPCLQSYFGLMQRTDYAEIDEPNKTLTEKAIMNACDTSKSLHASNNHMIESWPITKVVVFLVDSKKESCYLFHSSITQGVWSAIEKEVTNARLANKKIRVIKKTTTENQTTDGTNLLQLAYLAVKESCGINQCDLKCLENHSVYSTSKAKTAVRLFIMQCTQTINGDNLIPINDVMDSLQGPLVIKESGSWLFTPVVEYFHLLPFADKVSNWFKSGREISPNHPQHFDAAKEAENFNTFHTREEIENCTGTGSHLKEEPPLNVSDQNNTIFHEKEVLLLNVSEQKHTSPPLVEEPSLYISESYVVTAKLRNGNSCDLKEESVAFAPKHCDASKARNGGGSHIEESCPYTSQHFVAVKEAPQAAKGVRNGNSFHLEKESLQYASQPFNAPEGFRDVNSIHLNDELNTCTPQYPEAEKEVNNNGNSNRRAERTETVVYRKRNRMQKNRSSCKNPVSQTSNAPKDYQRLEEKQCIATASSNNVDIDDSGNTTVLRSVDRHTEQELMIFAEETGQTAVSGGAIVAVGEVPVNSIDECNAEKDLSDNKFSDTAMSDRDEKQNQALVHFDSDHKHLRKVQLTIKSKENLISQTALKNLFRKREKLSQQLRSIADEISLCDRSIQTVLSGDEDGLAVKIDSILDGCNEICMRTSDAPGDKTIMQIQDQDLPPVLKRKRLSEANLYAHCPCQELDEICNTNFWMLPTYSLSALEGGFQATVTVKGVDFECSSEGTFCTAPLEARKSAALNFLAKLRSMAAES